MPSFRSFLLVTLLCCWVSEAGAFVINGRKWPGAEALFYIDLLGNSGTGISWNVAFNTAMAQWNDKTPFSFSVIQQYKNPCSDDGFNGVDFAASFCGSSFGTNTLAITVRRFTGEVLGPPSVSQADIVINQNEKFNIYDGNLIQFGINGLDMQRIALHELGHALGLEHEGSKTAIMAPTIGNQFLLQADDIAGVETLYGGLSNCNIKHFNFGVISNSLDSSDCTVDALTVGSSDTSFIDLYQFDVADTTSFDFTMTSATLDSVLLLADSKLRIIAFDNKASNTCNSTLSTTLQPGSYFLLANTYNEPVKPECGNTGSYQIKTSFSSNSLLSFASAGSLTGGTAFGTYSGGITANNGVSFGNQFRSTDSLDMHASINIDPLHKGQAGFLVVAALIDQDIYLLNGAGQFVLFGSNPGVIDKAQSKVLSAIEDFTILTDLIPANLGISAIVVDFVVGYGVDSNPDEVYFHTTPLNLTVTP